MVSRTVVFPADFYSVTDLATYPGIARHKAHQKLAQTDLNQFPNVKRWFDEIGKRPAVQRGMAVPG